MPCPPNTASSQQCPPDTASSPGAMGTRKERKRLPPGRSPRVGKALLHPSPTFHSRGKTGVTPEGGCAGVVLDTPRCGRGWPAQVVSVDTSTSTQIVNVVPSVHSAGRTIRERTRPGVSPLNVVPGRRKRLVNIHRRTLGFMELAAPRLRTTVRDHWGCYPPTPRRGLVHSRHLYPRPGGREPRLKAPTWSGEDPLLGLTCERGRGSSGSSSIRALIPLSGAPHSGPTHLPSPPRGPTS